MHRRKSKGTTTGKALTRGVPSLCAAAGVAMVLAAASATATAAPISAPPDCNSSYNPYDYTPAALQECGVKTFPLTSVTDLPGGGATYNYDMGHGVVAHMTMPPAGFDALTASDAQLAEYGFPARPTDPAQLATWEQAMSHVTVAAPPPFLVELPNVTSAPPTRRTATKRHRTHHRRAKRAQQHAR